MTARLPVESASAAMLDRPVAVRVADVDKTYRSKRGEVTALSKLDFDVADEEFVTVVGPSGCGKSTILKIIAGLMPPTRGTVEVFGEAVKAPRIDAGMVFQSPRLLRWRTVLDNVLLPIEILGLQRSRYEQTAHDLLKLAGVHDFARMRPAELSGGMQQRVAICRALIHDPRLLLMDEPFGALDALSRDMMNVELMRIWNERRKTTVLITHSIQEAIFLADRVLVMGGRPGSIIAQVPIDLPRPRHPSVRGTARFQELSTQIHRLLGVEHV
ncbi:MAG TPA: ABC transporter ATP-binding protein [Burkholderiaceae bacterium]|nr:ABC transporter ATP-binding protein [Burkholderiaceae bacterium]